MDAGLNTDETLGGRGVEAELCLELGRDELEEIKAGGNGFAGWHVDPDRCSCDCCCPPPTPPIAEEGGGLPHSGMPLLPVRPGPWPANRGPPEGVNEAGCWPRGLEDAIDVMDVIDVMEVMDVTDVVTAES